MFLERDLEGEPNEPTAGIVMLSEMEAKSSEAKTTRTVTKIRRDRQVNAI